MDELVNVKNDAGAQSRVGVAGANLTAGLGDCPEELKNFIYYITLQLQKHRTLTDEQKDDLFQRAYRFYVQYDVENRNGA